MVVACWSPKGGVGKTVLAAALALRFRGMGHPALLVDLDPQKADVATLLQCPARPGLADWPLVAPALPKEALVEHHGIQVLPGPARMVEEPAVNRELAERLLPVLAGRPGQVVLDVGSSLRDSTLVALDRADTVLLVVTPDLLSIRAAYSFAQEMELIGLDRSRCRVVLNQAGRGLSQQEVRELLPLPVLGEVPGVPALAQAINRGEAVPFLTRPGPFTRAVDAIARHLVPAGAAPRAPRRRFPWLTLRRPQRAGGAALELVQGEDGR